MAYQRELGFPLFNDFDPFSAMMPFALGSARSGQPSGNGAMIKNRDMPLDVKEVRPVRVALPRKQCRSHKLSQIASPR